MLSVILMILKIIGIVLLSLLGLVLFLLLLVLLVPVRYRGKAEKAEAIAADVHVTWLLHLVHVIVSYGEDGLAKQIRIFGFALKDRNGDTDKKPDGGKNEAGDGDKDKEADTGKSDSDKADLGKSDTGRSESDIAELNKADVGKSGADKNGPKNTDATDKTDVSDKTDTTAEADIKTAAAGKDSEAVTVTGKTDSEAVIISEPTGDDKIPGHKVGKKKKSKKPVKIPEPEEGNGDAEEKQSFFDKLEAKKTDIAEKLKNIYNKLVHYKEIIDDPRFRNGIHYALNRLFAALRHILPRRLKGRAHYGFEDPSTTGYITAAVGATYGLFTDHMKFEPDFENEVLEGNIGFRGHARLGTVLFIALQVILKKDCRFVYKTIKAEGKD
jgi:hypothetical protein